MTHDLITPAAILAAQRRLTATVVRTPQLPSPSLTARAGVPIQVKWEQRQLTGSFKLRGATNAVGALGADDRVRGVVAVSTGNHGRGLAYAASAAGVRCVICMSSLVPDNKVAAIRALGAEVRIVGRSQDEAQDHVDALIRREGMIALSPFDHPDVIAGQGTLALEMLADCPEAEALVVPLSGGGLISGIAVMAKALKPEIRIIGVSMRRGAAMHASRDAGHPVPVEELPTLADALGGGVGLDNRYTFAIVRDLVDEIVLLEEEEIAGGIRHAYAEEQEVVEGAGAVGIGAVVAGKLSVAAPAVLLVSGRNIAMDLHRRIINGETPEVGGH